MTYYLCVAAVHGKHCGVSTAQAYSDMPPSCPVHGQRMVRIEPQTPPPPSGTR